MLAGARFGAILSALPLAAFLVGTLSEGALRFSEMPKRTFADDAWQWYGWPIANTALILLGCIALSAILFAVAALLSRERSGGEDASRQADRLREMRRHEIRSNSITALAFVGFFAAGAALLLVVQGGTLIAGASGRAAGYVTGACLIAAGSAVFVGLRYLAIEVLRGLPRKHDSRTHAVFNPVADDRPFDQRLAKYLEEQPTPAAGAPDGHRSPMGFFLAFLPGRRRGPRSPGAIRKILLRIHRLLGGSG